MKTCVIETEKICKSFVSDGEVNNVIKNLDMKLYQEDFTVIMGSSGSGKSTLLYLLSGMDKVTSGKVYLKEQEITGLKESAMADIRKDSIGFVFQNMNLIPDLTLLENVLSPSYQSKIKKEDKKKRADVLIEKMELSAHKNKFPNQLSGGQKQRTAICRALMNQPDILFADEPTGALNSNAGKRVLDTFTKLHEEGQSIVMVTHDLKAAVRGSRIIFLRDGRIDGDLEQGPFKEKEEEARERMLYEFLKERNW